MMINLIIDLVILIMLIFNNYPTVVLLFIRTSKELIKHNNDLFDNTIYIKHVYLV